MTVHDRYQVCDPKLSELIEAFPLRFQAFRCARAEAKSHGYSMEVFDVMAHQDHTEIWRVSPTGEVFSEKLRGIAERKSN